MSETPKKPVEASPELTRDLNYLLNRQPSGFASPSRERPAEPPDDHADFLATQAGGFAAAKAFAENRRVTQPSPGGSGGETTLTPNDPHGANIEWQYDPKWGLQWRGEWATGCHQPYFTTGLEKWVMTRERIALAERLSGDAAPRVEPTAEQEQQRARECIEAGCIWYRHANALSADVDRLASAPRPQEGEAAAQDEPTDDYWQARYEGLLAKLQMTAHRSPLNLAADVLDQQHGMTGAARVIRFVADLLHNEVDCASPLPPRDERPCSACNGTGRLRDARPGEMRDEPDVRAASPRPGAEATREDDFTDVLLEVSGLIRAVAAGYEEGPVRFAAHDAAKRLYRMGYRKVAAPKLETCRRCGAEHVVTSQAVCLACVGQSAYPAPRPVRSEEPTDG
jgi:hypothetical protein